MAEILEIDSRWIYTWLVGLVAAERAVEVLIARRHNRWLVAHGGIELGAGHYRWMVLLHSGFLVAAVAEVWLLDRPLVPPLAAAMILVLVTAMSLRYWVIGTLGRRWTTRVICLPGEPLIKAGPYRALHHPNYLAVVAEMVALPLVHTAWLTAIVFSLANAWVLRVRIRVEEEGLRRCTP
jgi:methyltransferase